jgi:sugar phosphate isomerase/epimerase
MIRMKRNFAYLFRAAAFVTVGMCALCQAHAASPNRLPASPQPSSGTVQQLPGVPQQAQTATATDFKGPTGLQLYSLRDQFKKDVPGALDKVKAFGIRYVELAGTYDLPADTFKMEMNRRGLIPISGHFPYSRFKEDPEAVAREAKGLGLKFAGCAWIDHKGDFDEKTCREAIEVFNKAGLALAKYGLKFFYHTHGYEFQPNGQGTLFDLLVKETNPKQVGFEMDIFWIVHPGQDPAKLLEKYPGRWDLMHLKDMKKGTKTGLLTGGTDVSNDVALGEGQIDLPATLRAAQKVGVKWYFIEDESPSVEQQLPRSLLYLKQVKL